MKQTPPNILFIMCDQLRADYLSCAGHPHLHTPNIDRLASNGVMFTRAYVQSPVCGPSRMCTYTGRYAYTHGATLNYAPLPLSELTLADYLKPLGVRTALVGKSHIIPNRAELERLNIPLDSILGRQLAEGGFEPYYRDDGVHPDANPDAFADYNRYLRAQNYNDANPWHTYANGYTDEQETFHSGWFLENSNKTADIPEEHSETTVTTTKAIEFIRDATEKEQAWCLHLSYIKPHWPVIAPAPYDKMYAASAVLPPNRTDDERENPHPVIAAFMRHQDSLVYTNEARKRIIPTYMGLIKQIDDQIGRLLTYLEVNNHLDNTVIIFTSDHGDYLGDHWLGEKDLFHEESARVPLIVVDPSESADETRGTKDDRLVEMIDLVPTLIDLIGGQIPTERLEGRSLLPLLHHQETEWRTFAVSEIDYSFRRAREWLGQEPMACRATMLRTKRWKYIYYEGFRPQLFDLENDPHEQIDLGEDALYADICTELNRELFRWFRQRKIRTTITDERIQQMFGGLNQAKRGVYVGYWSADQVPKHREI